MRLTQMNSHALVQILLVALLSLGATATAAPTGTAMVEMRDGTRLATDWYLPASGGPAFPIVLTRSYYSKGGSDAIGQFYNSFGYAYVAQDVRGRYLSEGTSSGWLDDGWGVNQDGVDTVAWLKAQSWCNGKIATVGGSALGITQLLLAGASQEVTCQSIFVASSDFYHQLAYQGGVFRKELVENWANGVGEPQVIALYKAHPQYDAFWTLHNSEARAPQTTAPGIHWGGWFDIFSQGTLNAFMSRQHQGGPGAASNQKLVIGPWIHGITPTAGELTFPNSIDFDVYGYEARYFEYWLKGVDNGIMDEPAVHYYTVGAVGEPNAPGNEWRTADNWPPFATFDSELYLANDGILTTGAPTDNGAHRSYFYDPAHPCPTRGGQTLTIAPGPMDQRPVSGRQDVLTFATPPLFAPVEIAGNVRVRLFVSSTAVDTDFTAKLVDIYPDGREMLLLDNIQRLKYRHGYNAPDPLPPGQVGEIIIDLWSISAVFNSGHRIGLQISSSNYPRFEVNPNTGQDFPGSHLIVAENTVYMDAIRPSALILPLRNPDLEIVRLPAASHTALWASMLIIAALAITGQIRRATKSSAKTKA